MNMPTYSHGSHQAIMTVIRSTMMRMTNLFHFQKLVIAATIYIVAAFLPSNAFSQFVFEDATESSKIFQSVAALADIGGGVVVIDLNNDGWEDLYLPGSAFA